MNMVIREIRDLAAKIGLLTVHESDKSIVDGGAGRGVGDGAGDGEGVESELDVGGALAAGVQVDSI